MSRPPPFEPPSTWMIDPCALRARDPLEDAHLDFFERLERDPLDGYVVPGQQPPMSLCAYAPRQGAPDPFGRHARRGPRWRVRGDGHGGWTWHLDHEAVDPARLRPGELRMSDGTVRSARVSLPERQPALAEVPSQQSLHRSAAIAADLAGWSTTHKFRVLVDRTLVRLPNALRHELLAALDPIAIGATVASWAGSHLLGVGFVVDVLLLAVGVAIAGQALAAEAERLVHCLTQVQKAQTSAELDAAADTLSGIASNFGSSVVLFVIWQNSR